MKFVLLLDMSLQRQTLPMIIDAFQLDFSYAHVNICYSVSVFLYLKFYDFNKTFEMNKQFIIIVEFFELLFAQFIVASHTLDLVFSNRSTLFFGHTIE